LHNFTQFFVKISGTDEKKELEFIKYEYIEKANAKELRT
jgi:hypothetical protein